jgi:hypothetical protein
VLIRQICVIGLTDDDLPETVLSSSTIAGHSLTIPERGAGGVRTLLPTERSR